eukprot:2609564-Prymnesium_polylepis.2
MGCASHFATQAQLQRFWDVAFVEGDVIEVDVGRHAVAQASAAVHKHIEGALGSAASHKRENGEPVRPSLDPFIVCAGSDRREGEQGDAAKWHSPGAIGVEGVCPLTAGPPCKSGYTKGVT